MHFVLPLYHHLPAIRATGASATQQPHPTQYEFGMTGASQLTYSGIGLAVFGQQFCLPVPSMLLLMTAGALAADGQGHLRLSLVVLSGVAGCLAADAFWFWLGRRWGSGIIRVVCSLTADPRASRERSSRIFARWGLKLLLVAKFIPGLDGISPPLAGAEGASVRDFLAYDTAGSLLWSGAYVLLGFIFYSQLDLVMHAMQRFATLLGVVVGVPLAAYVLWRALHLVRMIRHLRMRRISPTLLQEKINTDDRLAVFDLLHYEAHGQEIAGIPGSVRVDPVRFRTSKKVKVPADIDIVLYCSSRNDFVSARVAETLENRGVHNVWVLEGGLEAWELEGRPVTTELKSPEEVAAKFGIVLPPEVRPRISGAR
jgi:membrane protein DedA with SNARE-associated domain/rhodanese-related sulfurtransferase